MQVYVQKLTRTTVPARPSGVSGDEFSQPVAPSKPGRRPSTGNGAVRGWRRAPKRLTSRNRRPRRTRTRPGLPAEDRVRRRPQTSPANKLPGISSHKQSPPDGAPLASLPEERSSERRPSLPHRNERRRRGFPQDRLSAVLRELRLLLKRAEDNGVMSAVS